MVYSTYDIEPRRMSRILAFLYNGKKMSSEIPFDVIVPKADLRLTLKE